MKTCSKCKNEKPESQFYGNRLTKDGLGSWCVDCSKDWANQQVLIYPEKKRIWSRKAVRSWEKKNPEKVRQMRKKRNQKLSVRLRIGLQSRIWYALKGLAKSGRTKELLGCPIPWLEVHLESQFRDEMSWSNYGKVWHVDHIRPCASFDLTRADHQHWCFHWTNLQPLLVKENLEKGAKYSGAQ